MDSKESSPSTKTDKDICHVFPLVKITHFLQGVCLKQQEIHQVPFFGQNGVFFPRKTLCAVESDVFEWKCKSPA